MLKIESRRWVAVWYRCPQCGAQSAETMVTPWRYRHRHARECSGYRCNRAELEIVERRWYTTFCIEPGLSFTTTAGTLAAIGPFKLCDIVHRDIRAFRRWYRQARKEADERARAYQERERKVQEEWRKKHPVSAAVCVADNFDSFLDADDLP